MGGWEPVAGQKRMHDKQNIATPLQMDALLYLHKHKT